MRFLRAFEAAARHGSFSSAAEELCTTQSVVSRNIAGLERQLAVRLFERLHRGVRLTAAGEMYCKIVASALSRIAEGGIVVGDLIEDNRMVIACGHAVSEMFLMPRFHELHQALGEGSSVRVLVSDYDLLDRVADDADLVLTYDAGDSAPEDRAVAFREAVTALCSPAYAEEHADILRRPVEDWGPLTFLYLARPSRGWSTWDDWFEAVGEPNPKPRYVAYEDYVYLIDAACAGRGLALGWRYFLDRYVGTGALLAVRDGFVKRDIACFARLTERGRARLVARQCLEFFAARSRDDGTHG